MLKNALLLLVLLVSIQAQAGKVSVHQRIQSTSSLYKGVTSTATVDLNPKTGAFNDPVVQDLITLGVDHACDSFMVSPFEIKVKLKVTPYNTSNVAQTPVYPILRLEVRPFTDPVEYIDKFIYTFSSWYKYDVQIDEIKVNGVSQTYLPKTIYIDADINVERYYDFSSAATTPITMNATQVFDLDCDAVNDEIEVSWPTVTGAEEYQLEWTFINDYGTTTGTYLSSSNAALVYDFPHNSTRITTANTSYRITLAFDHGWLVFRVRGVGRDYLNPIVPVYQQWSALDKGQLLTSPTNARYNVTTVHEGNKNWQYSATYAEEGKKKEVISYFDGSQRNRQTVTKINSDNNVIVGQTIYDSQGRPAINVLPAPVTAPACTTATGPSIHFYDAFNQNDTTGKEYTRWDFDKDLTSDSCTSSAPGMNTTSGASNYYSPSNPNKTGFQAFVPDAQQYPYTQIEYTPDNTGRIRNQSGLGPDYKLGSGHESKYYYGQPNNIQLDRLFGSEVGDASHYKKNIVVDANGQVSVTYLDMEGRTIATALAGNPPTNGSSQVTMQALPSEATAETTLTADLFAKDYYGNSLLNSLDPEGDAIIFNQQLLVSYNSSHDFNYDITIDTIADACLRSNVCFNCVYDLEIRVTDECGVNLVPFATQQSGQPIKKTIGKFTTDSIGKLVFSTICTSPTQYTDAEHFTLNLTTGSYTVSKVLTLNSEARDFYVEAYLDSANNSCVKTLWDFQQEALANVDTSDCSIVCQTCELSLGTLEDWIASGKGTAFEYDFRKNECGKGCRESSPCEASYEMMLVDVSPQGQYGGYGLGTFSVSSYPLSVFNTANQLPKNVSSGTGHWKYPLLRMNGNNYSYYIDDNGNRSKVNVSVTTVGMTTTYLPAVDNTTLVYYDATLGTYFTYPENLANLSDFINAFQPSWAQSLVQYHPEYCYYELCRAYSDKQSGDYLTSDAFDKALNSAKTFQQAVSAGFIKSTYSSYTNPNDRVEDWFTATTNTSVKYDPFATNSYYQDSWLSFNINSTLSGKFLTYQSYGSSSYSMVQWAAMAARCGTSYNTPPGSTCMDFGMDVISGNTAYNDSIRDKEWNYLKGFYLAEKLKYQKQRADEYTRGHCDGYNGCIGSDHYNPMAEGMFDFSNLSSSPWYSTTQPCGYVTVGLYKDKQKRFPAQDILPAQGQSNIEYQSYLLTGQCPIAFDFQNLLTRLAETHDLWGHTHLSGQPQFTPDLYNVINGGVTPSSYIDYEWNSTVTSTHLDFEFLDTSSVAVCSGYLDLTGSGISNWSDILGFQQLTPTGGAYTFTIVAKLANPVPGGQPYIYKTLTGSTCFPLDDCKFKPQCEPNELALDLSNLMSLLASDIKLDGTNVYLPGSPYGTGITAVIENAVGAPNSDLEWNYAGSGVFELYDQNHPNDKIVLKFTSYAPMSFTHSDIPTIMGFANMNSDYQNFFAVDGLDATLSKIVSIKGEAWRIDGNTGDTIALSMGKCGLPDPVTCVGTTYELREDLEDLIKKEIEKKLLETAPRDWKIDYTKSTYFTSLLQNAIPEWKDCGESYSEYKITQGDDIVESLSGGLCGCTLDLTHIAYNGEAQYTLDDIMSFVSGLIPTGNTDANGNYHDFYFLVEFGTLRSAYIDTLFGTSCLGIKPCNPCSEEPSGGGELLGTMNSMSTMSESQDSVAIVQPTPTSLSFVSYLNYSSIVDSLNQVNGWTAPDSLFIHKIGYAEYANKGYYFSEHTFLRYLKSYEEGIDNRIWIVHPDSFIIQYGNHINCEKEYARYSNAIQGYNTRAAVVTGATALIPVPDSVFFQNYYCDSLDIYVRYLRLLPDSGNFAQSIQVFFNGSTIPPADTCRTLYEQYIDLHKQYFALQQLDTTCALFNTFYPLYSYNEFITADACSSGGLDIFNDYINSFTTNNCPQFFPTVINVESESSMAAETQTIMTNETASYLIEEGTDCAELYYIYLQTVRDYNNSKWAEYHNYYLDSTLYPDYTSFVNAGLCDCAEAYINYLSPYIIADIEDNLPLPVDINEYCGVVKDNCDDAYNNYVHSVNQYNQYVLDHPELGLPYIYDVYKDIYFAANGYCYCVDKFVAWVTSVTEGNSSAYDEAVSMVDIGQWCDDFIKPPCTPTSVIDTFMSPPYTQYDNPCAEQIINIALANAEHAYQEYRDSIAADFNSRYTQHCMSAVEDFTDEYQDKEYHFTLYYYDQAGNLVKTIPPEGVRPLAITGPASLDEQQVQLDRATGQHTIFTSHQMSTVYEYNSLNQLVKQSVPDHDQMDIFEFTLSNGLDSRLKVTSTQFINSSRGYLTGSVEYATGKFRGYMYITNDGGATWQRVTDLVGADIHKVQMLDSWDGYAVASNGIVLRTADGGSSWDMIPMYSYFSEDLNDLIFLDVNTGVVVGDNGKAAYTINAGSTWTVATGFLAGDNITGVTYDGTNYYATVSNNGGRIYKSSNGTTWTQQTSFTATDLKKVTVDNGMIYAVGDDGTLLKKQVGSVALVATGTAKNIRDVYFTATAGEGISIIDSIPGKGQVYKTFDDGNTWELLSPPGEYYTSLQPYGVNKLVAAGEDGLVALIFTQNHPFGMMKLAAPTSGNLAYAAAQEVSGNVNIIAVGNNQNIWYTSNGLSSSVTWTTLNTAPTVPSGDANFKKVLFGNNSGALNGVLLTQTGKVFSFFKAATASTFTFSTITGTGNFTDIAYRNPYTSTPAYYAYEQGNAKVNTITFAGSGPPLGTTTALSPATGMAVARSLAVTNSGDAYLVGDNGEIVTANITSTFGWTIATNIIQPVDLNDIAYTSSNNLFAVGNDGSMWKTTDGSSWKLMVTGVTDKLNAAKLQSSTTGVVAANNGVLYKQIISGNTATMTLIPVNTSNDLNSVDISSSGEVAVSADGGKVFRVNNLTSLTVTSPVPNPVTVNFYGVCYVPTTTQMVAVGSSGRMYTYMGSSGMKNNMIFTPIIKDAHFTNDMNGYTVGENGTIRHTQNGGINWSVVIPSSTNLTSPMNRVWTLEADKALIIGDNGYVGRVNSTVTPVTIATGTTSWKDIGFNMPTHGYIVGSSKASAWVSVSGNTVTVTSITGPSGTFDFRAVHVFNNGNFIAAGTGGNVFVYNGTNATNGSWVQQKQNISTSAVLNDVYFHDDRTGYAVGDGGLMYRINATSNLQAIVTANSVPWTQKALTDDYGITSGNQSTVDMKTIGFATRYKGFVGGSFNTITTIPVYARRLQDESEYYSTYFYYDRLGRMVVSQNTKQFNKKDPLNTNNNREAYSYTLYDALGRIKEVGEKFENYSASVNFNSVFGVTINSFYNSNVMDDTKLQNWINESNSSTVSRYEVTSTYYDDAAITGVPVTQENLRKRVASTTYEDTYDGNDNTYDHATHYTYDIHGNVKTLVQDNPNIGVTAERYKRLDYDYDLISGKANEVKYQEGEPDQFYHKYEYDADNRITTVYTSRDNVIWDNDAKYFYYAHGPLARVETGDDQVQGTDFAYTLLGWIKGVNSNMLVAANDIGQDGQIASGNLNQNFAKDVFGYSLGYYSGDYTPIDATKWTNAYRFESITAGSDLEAARYDLFNGNISHMVTTIVQPGTLTYNSGSHTPLPQGTAYHYDQLNRLIQMQAYDNLTMIGTGKNEWASGSTYADRYLNQFSYDANGNINSQARYSQAGTQIEHLTYNYKDFASPAGRQQNRLYWVAESVGSGVDPDDIDDQSSFNGTNLNDWTNNFNYSYDEIGNLRKDFSEEIADIKWTVYGKIKEVTRTNGSSKKNLKFDYDASGNRIAKHVYSSSNIWENSTFYLRDGQGNVMGVYKQQFVSSLLSHKLIERDIYGNSRVGMDVHELEMIGSSIDPDSTMREIGQKQYEFSNHLGNVLAVITDKKIARDNNSDLTIDEYLADMITANDYSPYGVLLDGRNFYSSNYKYGFGGKEKDNELKNVGNSYDFGDRIYDNRLGRWWSCDPKQKKYPTWSPYHFGYCSPIVTIDKNGDENIVVVGSQHESDAGNKLMFMNQALRQIIAYSKNESDESRTVLLFTEGYTQKQINRFKQQVAKYGGTVQEITSAKSVENYINSKTIYSGEVGDARNSDKVTNVDAFSHGVPGSIEFGYDMENKDIARFTVSNARNLNPQAFGDKAVFTSYACRTGDGNNLLRFDPSGIPLPEASLAQQISNSAEITVRAFMKRSDYSSTLGSTAERQLYKAYDGNKYLQSAGYWKNEYKSFKQHVEGRENIDGATFTPDGAWSPVMSGSTPWAAPAGMQTYTPKTGGTAQKIKD